MHSTRLQRPDNSTADVDPQFQHDFNPVGSLAATDLFLGALGALLLLIARISFGIHVNIGRLWKFGKFAKSGQTNAT